MNQPVSLFSEHPWIAVAGGVLVLGVATQTALQDSSRLQDLGVRRITTALLSPSNWWAGGFLAWILTGRISFLLFSYVPFFYFSAAHPKPGPAAQGDLQRRIENLGVHAGVKISDSQHWAWDQTNVCIVHDTFSWWTSTASSDRYLFVPLRYLGWLNRAEIDAIVARQLCVKKARAQEPWFIAILIYAVIVAILTSALHLSVGAALKFMAVAVLIEIIVLLTAWPYFNLQIHLRAIQLTGNAEAYISAQSELSRLNKTPLNHGVLARIAVKTLTSQQRLSQLMDPASRPPQDCYSLHPSYLRTGR